MNFYSLSLQAAEFLDIFQVVEINIHNHLKKKDLVNYSVFWRQISLN
jgi:hypothetical protein